MAPALAQAAIAEAIAPDTLCRVPALAGPGKTTPLPRAAQRLAGRRVLSCAFHQAVATDALGVPADPNTL